ncbi:amino acid carrier protein [Neisseriaceae bacterium PsAf]|nr:amino acid carrier protein [Neisseriaceae bacterium PsAf]
MLVLLLGTGLFLTIRLGFLQFRKLGYALKLVFTPPKHNDDDEGDISHFAALMTALSATIGTGNIAGVATAVVVGGPGAVFWMWITALVGMATKYSEAVLAVKYRVTDEKGMISGGPMYYIQNGLNKKWLGICFAIFATIASFGIGSSVQANSIAESIQESFHIDVSITGIFLTILTAIVILGGVKSIARVASFIVPFMAIVYVLGGLAVILAHLDLIMPAIKLIFHDAFTGSAVAGGLIGKVVQSGVSRGLFSNEAGLGSAPIAAAAAKTDHPVRQALVSMTGTFFDTIVVCTITGLVLVVGYLLADNSFPLNVSGDTLNGAALTTATFQTLLPGPGGWIVTFGLVFFAYSTILGWSYYGEKSIQYLFGTKGVLPYRIVYTCTVMLGSILTLDLVWTLANIFNALMAIPNLIALLLLSGVVVAETKDFYRKKDLNQIP